MGKARLIAVLLVVVVCILLLHIALRRQIHKTPEFAESTAINCDQKLWEYVYKPERLHVLNSCMSVTGSVEEFRREADGDVHIRFRLDPQFELLLNERNISRQYGNLVLESVCQGKVRQADAVDPCSRYSGPYFEPRVGQRYLVWGAYVYDADHGWNELHPISSMEPIE